MRTLLDTNIIIHRESQRVLIRDIGNLFYWLDKLHYVKCVHPFTIDEIRKYKDSKVVEAFEAKLDSYHILKTQAPLSAEVERIRRNLDKTPNDIIDTAILNELFSKRVDLLITEDRSIHEKAKILGISERVFTIDTFLEKVTAENPELVAYKVLSVKKEYFGNLNLADSFFDSFRRDYQGFDEWFHRKSDEIAYVCSADNGDLLAFLYIKKEDEKENYRNIDPEFMPKNRLKIGTMKVIANGFKLGERFLKIIFDNALVQNVGEIYVTVFDHTEDQIRLIKLLQDWGFVHHGGKTTESGIENVYVREFSPTVNRELPRLC